MDDQTARIAEILRGGEVVRIVDDWELEARFYKGYVGRDPRTGARVDVPGKAALKLRRAENAAPAQVLKPDPEIVKGARVWPISGVGLIYGFDKGGKTDLRGFLPFVAMRAALNESVAPEYADGDAIDRVLASAPRRGDTISAIACLVARRSGRVDAVDPAILAHYEAAKMPPSLIAAVRELGGADLGAIEFCGAEELEPSEEDPLVPSLAFADAMNESRWQIELRNEGAVVVEKNAEPNDVLTPEAFLGQAALAVEVLRVAKDNHLRESTAIECWRAMLGHHAGTSKLARLLPI